MEEGDDGSGLAASFTRASREPRSAYRHDRTPHLLPSPQSLAAERFRRVGETEKGRGGMLAVNHPD